MGVHNKKRMVGPKKNAIRRVKKKARVRRGPKKTAASKVAILERSGLIGCLTGTGVTSKNYKDLLLKA